MLKWHENGANMTRKWRENAANISCSSSSSSSLRFTKTLQDPHEKNRHYTEGKHKYMKDE